MKVRNLCINYFNREEFYVNEMKNWNSYIKCKSTTSILKLYKYTLLFWTLYKMYAINRQYKNKLNKCFQYFNQLWNFILGLSPYGLSSYKVILLHLIYWTFSFFNPVTCSTCTNQYHASGTDPRFKKRTLANQNVKVYAFIERKGAAHTL